MRAAQVLGIAHGGTTIIDRILSSYPRVIGLGEAQQIWKKIEKRTLREFHQCPCGESHLTCPFWGKFFEKSYATSDEYFRGLVETAESQDYDLIVDTSKTLLSSVAYMRLRDQGLVDEVIQIRLVRDPRGWAQSMIRRYKIDPGDANAIRGLLYRWLFTHVKLDRKVFKHDNTRVYVWYDKLAIEESQNKLAGLMGLDLPPDGQISLKDANQHAIAGNNFIHSRGRERLRYDGTWMENKLLEDLYAEMQPVRDYYHVAQTLHLTKDSWITHAREVGAEVKDIEAAAATGEFGAIDEQARMLTSVAELPQAEERAAA